MTAPVPEDKLRLGGMALRNGLLVHGPEHWAAAVRTPTGEVKVASGRKPDLGGRASERVPGLRGVAKLGEAFVVIPLVKRALPEARLPMEDRRTVLAVGAAAVASPLIRRAGPRTLAREAMGALLGLAPAVTMLRAGDLAAWHGVEHKSIAAYEEDAVAAEADKEHDRCGSNLVAPLLVSTVSGNVALRRAGVRGPAADGLVALGSVGLAVEVFLWSERHAGSRLARALRRPGYELQR